MFGLDDCLHRPACDRIGGVPDVDFSLLDVPRKAPVHEAEVYLRAAMAWHFGEDTGSVFWLGWPGPYFQPADRHQYVLKIRRFPNP